MAVHSAFSQDKEAPAQCTGVTKRDGISGRTPIAGATLRAPGGHTFAHNARGLSRLRLRHPQPWWSRPMTTDGCSVVARMPRYGPAASGIRSAQRIPATGQNGSSRHGLALFDSRSRRISEYMSGLLIGGFGVQAPGGAPGLTWGFAAEIIVLLLVLSPCLLHVWSRAGTRSWRACQKRPRRQRTAAARRGTSRS
jgi:hypothetical protein